MKLRLLACQHVLAGALIVALLGACVPQGPPSDASVVSPKEAPLAFEEREAFSVVIADTNVGELIVEHDGDASLISFSYSNNGRGPTFSEKIAFDMNGAPRLWQIEGQSVFGNQVSERFTIDGDKATWTDATGSGERPSTEGAFYVAQNASPYSFWLYARLLLDNVDRQAPVFPGGVLRLEKIESFDVTGDDASQTISSYALSGIGLDPNYIFLNQNGGLFASANQIVVVVEEGYENAFSVLRDKTVAYSAQRYEDIQARIAHSIGGPVRITNVHVFDPVSKTLSSPVSVMFEKGRIMSIDPADKISNGETQIDAQGGTLVPGMYEMHGHMSQQNALLNIAAGVTSVRDMGNSNVVLDDLIAKIAAGTLAGPRITRSGFIEGASPFSANNGIVVANEEEAVDAVRMYGERGDFDQIKIYSSIKGEWVPAMVAEARKYGLGVSGHVPAFATADEMIEAGYDELTHMNQAMLGWVMDQGEDTRTLLRVTAMKRVANLDLEGPSVQRTIAEMVKNQVAIDPTLAIFELLFLSRNGVVAPGSADIVDHMPVGMQRQARTAWVDANSPQDDEDYRAAFWKTVDTMRIMREVGIQILPGTDLGGSFSYHRELELYREIGFSDAEILSLATLEMATYLGQDDQLGSIEAGKYADFFLVPGNPVENIAAIKSISMVVANGVIYFPSDIYPEFGILPFAPPPEIQPVQAD